MSCSMTADTCLPPPLPWVLCPSLCRYLYTRKYESGGACFPVIFERLLGCLAIMVLSR